MDIRHCFFAKFSPSKFTCYEFKPNEARIYSLHFTLELLLNGTTRTCFRIFFEQLYPNKSCNDGGDI